MTGQQTEVWLRDPQLYIRECLEVGVRKLSWSRKFVVSRRIDPYKYVTLHYGQYPFEILICDDMGSQHFASGNPDPVAVYPTWLYGDDWSLLEKLCTYEPGLDEGACSDPTIPKEFRPRLGQERRIVIMGSPPLTSGIGKKFYRSMSDLQEQLPDVTLHMHGCISFEYLFGLSFRSVDYDGRRLAFVHQLHLPNGMRWYQEKDNDLTELKPWLSILGYNNVDLSVPRNRCMFNIQSAMWAGKFFKDEYKFRYKHRKDDVIDDESPDDDYEPITSARIFTTNVIPEQGDKFLCDTCSLQLKCRYFRTGAVCIVPDAEPKELATYFKTRNAETIIDGLGTLLAAQTRRLERGMTDELLNDEKPLDPEVTKILNSVFDRAERLAKLLNPMLGASPKVQINQQTINNGSPQQLMASVIAELEARGISRDDITPEMIESVLSGSVQTAIEAQVIE